jgi:8-oxo-dGTP pyrophosphatase MutT (NUDIX family)
MIKDGQILFCFGVDRKHQELTDFSGGRKRGEEILVAAIREWTQEAGNIFPQPSIETVMHSIAIHNDTTFILLLRVAVDPEEMQTAFRRKVVSKGNDEISDIVWVTASDLQHLLLLEPQQSPIYSVVSDLLSHVWDSQSSSCSSTATTKPTSHHSPGRKEATTPPITTGGG